MKRGKKTESSQTGKSAANAQPDPTWSVARLCRHFGVPAERLLLHPRAGMATEEDLLYVNEHGDRLCELVDGVLVEKAMGFREAFLAGELLTLLRMFLGRNNLGIVVPPDATIRFFPGLVRLPDVSFISWDRLPGRAFPEEPVPDLAPDLAVEVLSKGNTPKEMKRKLGEYFRAGVRLVWFIDPAKEVVEVYTSPRRKKEVRKGQTLDGGEVLPGFSLSLTEFFATPKAPPAP
jgi:Uma2 family endonuclease